MKLEKQKDYIDMAFNLFKEICSQFSLSYEQDKEVPVELYFKIPKQKGLKFDITLMLQNYDELWLSTDKFILSMFPCSKPEVVWEFKTHTLDLLSGKARIIKYISKYNYLIKSELQTFDGTNWKKSSLYRNNIIGMIIAKIFPSRVKEQIVQNIDS
jgi:hypothetical protein